MLVTEAQVRSFVMPSHIVATETFTPLAHGTVLDAIESALGKSGLQLARNDQGELERSFTIVDKGAKMYATLPLTNHIDDESQLMIGIVNSWNKSLSLRLGFGSRVFVCTNGCFFAEKVVGRKHTPNILRDLPDLLTMALAQTATYIEGQRKFFERLRTATLTDKDVNDFVVRSAMDREVITVGEIADVVAEWRTPRYEEFAPRTAWSLHNAYTEVGKRVQKTNGVLHAERMVRLTAMFAETFAHDLSLTGTGNTASIIAAAQTLQ